MPTTTPTRNPLYTLAGAGDLAVATLRELPGELARIQQRVKPLQEQATTLPAQLGAQLRALPATVKVLQGSFAEQAVRRAGEAGAFVESLNARGAKVVAQVRRQPAGGQPAAKSRPATRRTGAQTG